MPARKQQTHAKRARELAVKERRERKQAKKAERRAGIALGDESLGEDTPGLEDGEDSPGLEEGEDSPVPAEGEAPAIPPEPETAR
jgi:hypothetical protein